MSRLFDFQGNDSDYIKFLESKLLEARTATSSARRSSITSHQASPTTQNSSKIQFVIVKPKLSQIRRSPPTPAKWKTQLNDFINSIPSDNDWEVARCDAGIYTIQKNRRAIQLMLGRQTEAIFSSQNHLHPQIPSILPTDNEGLILRACKYGTFISTCADEGNFASRVAEYQKLIFISYCTVLIHAGNSKQTVYSMMRQYINKTSDDKTLDYYRYGALWVNKCIASLLKNGLGHRSWEIFLLREYPTSLLPSVWSTLLTIIRRSSFLRAIRTFRNS